MGQLADRSTAAAAPAAAAASGPLAAPRRRAALPPVWARLALAAVVVALLLGAFAGAHDAAQTTVNGIVTGTYFALGAVGLSLVFGVLRLVNFAHGDFLTFAAYVGILFGTTLGLPIVLAGALAVAATAALAVGSEFAIWRPMRARGAGAFQLLLIAIGLAFVIRNAIQLFAGSLPRRLDVDVTSALDLVGNVRIGRTQLVVVCVGVVALVAVGLLLSRTRVGKEMRALADNLPLAEVSGIDTQRVIVVTWAVAGTLAGLAGVLAAAAVGVVTPNFGWILLLSLFAASVLGGLQSAYGALAGGLVLGLAEEWSTIFVDPRWKYAIGFGLLIGVLLVRPNGLFGKATLR